MQQDMYYLGQICLFPYYFKPQNFIKCDGSLLPVDKNEALFSIIGTKFGGNGVTEFRIPNLKPLVDSEVSVDVVHYYICIEGQYPPRD